MNASKTVAQLAATLVAAAALSLSACAFESTDDGAVDHEETAEAQEAMNYGFTPSSVCVTANESTNSGTSNSIEVGFFNVDHDYFECTIASGVGTGASACCTPSKRSVPSGAFDSTWGFRVGYTGSANTDGLRVTAVKASNSANSYSIGTFTSIEYTADCEGCTLGTYCNSCWIDSDDHGKCTNMLISAGLFEGPPGSNWVSCLN